ncbi:DUF2487 family protein [Aquibacillus sediminis]|uniref:DUF2487 family protein n=1 Tax=Aquibacillus sediminis TaxID=2574734 RepID=UPI001107A892|nr:DUF2487 family protein [Aquibacillus sediminis]
MQWNNKDLEQYIDEKVIEYVDTLLIPLMPISLKNDKNLIKRAFQAELLSIFGNELERQFKGRMFLMPIYHYLSTADKQLEVTRLNEWVEDALTNPFKHVLFLTLDSDWKKVEAQLQGEVLWFPSMQSGDLQSDETKGMVKDQISQLTDLIKTYW